MRNEIREEHDISKPHRDNHFLLMLATSGHFKLNIDFNEVAFCDPTLFCVFPEQFHHIIEVQKPEGWIISFDQAIIDEEVKQLFESKFYYPILLAPESDFYQSCVTLLHQAILHLLFLWQTEMRTAVHLLKTLLIDY